MQGLELPTLRNRSELISGAPLSVEDAMTASRVAATTTAVKYQHELRFTSLFDPGRGVVVPCDYAGHVDFDALTERQKLSYLGARAMIG